MGGTLDLVHRDAADIIKGGGFQTEITFKELTGEVLVSGTVTHPNFSVGEDGQAVNSKNVHATVNETDLVEGGITTRDGNNDIALRGKILSFTDSRGILDTWIVREFWPTRTFGHVVLILGSYNG